MSQSAIKTPNMSSGAVHNKINIPVQLTDLSTFDDVFSSMKERFTAEMRRMDEEMTRFSTELLRLYGQSTTAQSGVTPSQQNSATVPTAWESITASPLVQDEGETKTLKLQFDVSQFDPSEVNVKILNNVLIVSARHEEKTDKRTVFREYNREFSLPRGTNPESIVSSLSRDGVLTVQAPLPKLSIAEKNISLLSAPKP